MSNARCKILSVDDEPVNQMVIEEIMDDQFDIKLVYSGEECLDTVVDYKPDLILLDISMPGINGYETCERLKSENSTRNIPVIILSALSSTEERLMGYEAGAEDYIPKPFDHDELIGKIGDCLDSHSRDADKIIEEKQVIEKELQESRNVAMEAMRYTSDLGAVVQFFESSSSCKSFAALADCILNSTNALGLTCVVQLRNGDSVFNASSAGEVSPMEASVLVAAKEQGRFFDFKSSTFVNYVHSTILIKNMPLDDELKYGKIKDILGALGNSAEERAKAISTEIKIKQNRQEVISLVKDTISNINEQFMGGNRDTTAVMEKMVAELLKTIDKMDLLEYQEQELVSIMDSFIQQNEVVVNNSLDLQEAANATYNSLNDIFDTLIGDD